MTFTRYEPVTVTDTSSPFYWWSGTVEKVDEEKGLYTIKAISRGTGIRLWLTFREQQLTRGLPVEDE